MEVLGGKEFWVDLINYGSIVGVAIFAMVGAFTEYKRKGGAITNWGRFAAVGIVLSAAFAMASAILQKQIEADHRKAAEERATREQTQQDTRFNTQLDQLLRLNAGVISANVAGAALRDRMEISLRAQDRLLASARHSMLMTAGLTKQERENTGRVLQGLWEEANRITGDRIRAEFRLACLVADASQMPVLFPQGANAELILAPNSDLPSHMENLFTARPMVLSEGLILRSSDQRTRIETGQRGETYTQTTSFSPFVTFRSLGPLASPDNWTNLRFELRLSAEQPGIRELFERIGRDPLIEKRELMAGGRSLSFLGNVVNNDDYRVSMAPCMVWMTLVVNDRTVVHSEGWLLHVQERANDRRGLMVAWFGFHRVPGGIFPRYAQPLPAPRRR